MEIKYKDYALHTSTSKVIFHLAGASGSLDGKCNCLWRSYFPMLKDMITECKYSKGGFKVGDFAISYTDEKYIVTLFCSQQDPDLLCNGAAISISGFKKALKGAIIKLWELGLMKKRMGAVINFGTKNIDTGLKLTQIAEKMFYANNFKYYKFL